MRRRAAFFAFVVSLRAWRRGQAMPLAALAALYVFGLASAGAMISRGVQFAGAALTAPPAPRAPPAAHSKPALPAGNAASMSEPPRPASVSTRRDAFMSFAADRSSRPLTRIANPWGGPVPFPSRRGDDFDDDDEGRRPMPAYRTVCVRMCDGYYFPISYATGRERFARDAQTCQNQCGSEARLFVHRNPGETPEQMVDLQGRPYAQLPNAFLYRTQYVVTCKCKPDPWEPEAKERHRVYALMEQARKGNRAAQIELKALEKSKPDGPARIAAGLPPLPDGPLAPAPALNGEKPMGLGLGAAPRPGTSSGGLPDWARRAFNNY